MVFLSTNFFKKLIAFVIVIVAITLIARSRLSKTWSVEYYSISLDAYVYIGSVFVLNLFLSHIFGIKSNTKWLIFFVLLFLTGADYLSRYFEPWLYSKGFQFIRITVGSLREFVSIIPVLPVLFLGFQSGYLKR